MRNDGTARIPALDELRDEFIRVGQAETGAPTRRRLRLAAVAIVAVALFSSGAAARMLIGSEMQPQTPPRPKGADEPADALRPPAYAGFTRYRTLPELIVNSAVVVVGTVQEVTPGAVIESEMGSPTRYVDTVIAVDETWKGTVAETITVATNELAYGGGAIGSEWREPGVRVVAFLVPPDSEGGDPSVLYPADEPAIYVLSGDVVVPTVSGTFLSDEIAALSLKELRRIVVAAAQAS